jgi:hypothetical protein
MTRTCRAYVQTVAFSALLALGGCGGGGGSPSAPSANPSASGLDFNLIPAVNGGSVVEFRWTGSDATSYVIEIGRSPGASDVATLESPGAATTLSWTGVPIGTFYARVRGKSGSTLGSPSSEVLVGSLDARYVIEALVFGAGPLAVAGNAAGPIEGDRMEGWQPGSAFEIILGESLPATYATAAQTTAEQIGTGTRGVVRASVRGRQPDPLPAPRPGEVTVSYKTLQEIKDECRCDSCVGCASTFYLGSFVQRVDIRISSDAQPATVAHELGHAIGLAHIISAAGVRPPFTLGVTTDGQYSPNGRIPQLDPATVKMLDTVYGAGLSAGSSRRQFEALGFVIPASASAATRATRALPRGTSVSQYGLETVVTRPVCR